MQQPQWLTWGQMKERFFKGLQPLLTKGESDAELNYIHYEPDKFLYSVDDDGAVIRLPKGGWSIMDALVPEILDNVGGPIVEIGMGESTSMFAAHASRMGRKLYSCDIKMGGMFDVCDKPLFDNHVCFIGRSEDFIKEFKDYPAIVFIDGEHLYETAKMEVEFFLPRLAISGVMFMHDTFPWEERLTVTDKKGRKAGDVYKVRQELERNPDVDVLTWPYTALGVGLTMVLKHLPNKKRPFWLQNGRVFHGE